MRRGVEDGDFVRLVVGHTVAAAEGRGFAVDAGRKACPVKKRARPPVRRRTARTAAAGHQRRPEGAGGACSRAHPGGAGRETPRGNGKFGSAVLGGVAAAAPELPAAIGTPPRVTAGRVLATTAAPSATA